MFALLAAAQAVDRRMPAHALSQFQHCPQVRAQMPIMCPSPGAEPFAAALYGVQALLTASTLRIWQQCKLLCITGCLSAEPQQVTIAGHVYTTLFHTTTVLKWHHASAQAISPMTSTMAARVHRAMFRAARPPAALVSRVPLVVVPLPVPLVVAPVLLPVPDVFCPGTASKSGVGEGTVSLAGEGLVSVAGDGEVAVSLAVGAGLAASGAGDCAVSLAGVGSPGVATTPPATGAGDWPAGVGEGVGSVGAGLGGSGVGEGVGAAATGLVAGVDGAREAAPAAGVTAPGEGVGSAAAGLVAGVVGAGEAAPAAGVGEGLGAAAAGLVAGVVGAGEQPQLLVWVKVLALRPRGWSQGLMGQGRQLWLPQAVEKQSTTGILLVNTQAGHRCSMQAVVAESRDDSDCCGAVSFSAWQEHMCKHSQPGSPAAVLRHQ
jgi:hypothetical protein